MTSSDSRSTTAISPHVWVADVHRAAMTRAAVNADTWCRAVCGAIHAASLSECCAVAVTSDVAGATGHAVLGSIDPHTGSAWTHRLLLGETEHEGLGLYGQSTAHTDVKTSAGQCELCLAVAGTDPGWVGGLGIRQGIGLLGSLLVEVFARNILAPASYRNTLLACLQPAQRDILPLLVMGLTQPEIAERIERSRHTVHDHTKRIYQSLGVHNRAELAALWFGHRQAVSTPDAVPPV